MPSLPYEPRRRSQRPDRALPPPPTDEASAAAAQVTFAANLAADASAPTEDFTVGVSNAFDSNQGYLSPPSPPRGGGLSLSAQLGEAMGDLTIDENGLDVVRGEGAQPSEGAGEGEGNGDAEGAPAKAASPAPASVAAVPAQPVKRVRPPVPKTHAAHLNPYYSTLPNSEAVPPTILTPLRAHYLKKMLVNKQVNYELNLITDPVLGANALGLLGAPFVLPDAAKQHVAARIGAELGLDETGDLPFLRFIFHQFLLPFPFLAAAPPSFWSAKVQPFLSSFLATTGVSAHATLSPEEREIEQSLMTKDEKKEAEERKKLWVKGEKHLGLMIAVGIKLVSGEEVVRIGQSELRRIEAAAEDRKKKWIERNPNAEQEIISFEVNVVGVRSLTEKGRVRSKSHEEFFIRTQRTGVADVYVSRRYGDFRRLAEELRLHFPDLQLPNPPPKDKTVTAPVQTQSQGYAATLAAYNPLRALYGSSPSPSGTSTPNRALPPNPAGEPQDDDPDALPSGPLTRERNRLTLRAYLHSILVIPQVSNSPVMRSFLLSHPVTLTPAETHDVQRRLEADAVREEGRKRFRDEAERRVEALREGLTQFKGDILSRDGGLKSVFDVVRRVERVEDLPRAEKSVVEWGRISLASTIFQHYVASDTASETLAGLKRIHGIMPYFVLKGILKISNPMAMIRGLLDLFLARPFGGQSLLQRMFSTSLAEDVRYLTEDIVAVQDKIDDPIICQKIEQYANAPFAVQEKLRREVVAENTDLLVAILRQQEMPLLNRPQIQRVFRASRAYKEYKAWQAELSDSDDDDGPSNDDAWLFEDLNILLKLMTRKKEKEAMIALIFEGVTADLLKDIITIFYTPLAQVYKAASIADSLGDLQAFINDMIRTVEAVEELAQEDPGRTVQTFIDLVQRHEQSFYTFVHNVHSKGKGLFDSLMDWIELFLSYAREGLGAPLDLEVLLPHDGPERAAIMKEVDAVAQYHYKLKVAHEEKVRRRFAGASGAAAEGETAEEAALLDSVMASLNIGDTTVGAAGEIAIEESEDTTDDEDESGDDGEQSDASPRKNGNARSPPPRFGQGHNDEDGNAPPPVPPKDDDINRGPVMYRPRKRKAKSAPFVPPATPNITAMRPLFVEVVKPLLVPKPLVPGRSSLL